MSYEKTLAGSERKSKKSFSSKKSNSKDVEEVFQTWQRMSGKCFKLRELKLYHSLLEAINLYCKKRWEKGYWL